MELNGMEWNGIPDVRCVGGLCWGFLRRKRLVMFIDYEK